MIDFMRRLDRWLVAIENVLAVILFLTLAAAMAANILLRNLFHVSLDIVLAYSPTLVLWLALIGASLALRENRHIRLELFLRFAPARMHRAARAASSVFGMVVMAVLGVSSVSFVKDEIAIFGAGGWLSAVFPAFFAAAFFRFFSHLVDSTGEGSRNGASR